MSMPKKRYFQVDMNAFFYQLFWVPEYLIRPDNKQSQASGHHHSDD